MYLLRVRRAKAKDRSAILAFCQDTFSWGDYIDRVWDLWMKEGMLYVLADGDVPISLGHASLSKKQVWIEGLRVNPVFRRQGYASKVVLHIEKMAKTRNCKISRMLIAQDNTGSLSLAKSLGYSIESGWWLYYAEPKRQKSKTRTAINQHQIRNLDLQMFTESWKWHALDRQIISRLLTNKQIVICGKGTGIWNLSEIDGDIIQVGYLQGPKADMQEIIRFVQNKAYHTSKRIQILVPECVRLDFTDVTKRMGFHLMRKDI